MKLAASFLIAVVIAVSSGAMAQTAKKQTAKPDSRAVKDEKCCLSVVGRWDGKTSPGLCYGLRGGGSAIYNQCTGRISIR